MNAFRTGLVLNYRVSIATLKLIGVFILLLTANDCAAGNHSIEVGAKAPNFTLPNLEGKDVNLEQLISNKKYSLILIWGVWCPYCRAIIVDLKQSAADYKKSGVQLVAVSIGESSFKVSIFINQLQPGFPVLVDEWASLKEPYLVKDVPRIVLLDQKGIVRHTSITTSIEEIRILLESLKK